MRVSISQYISLILWLRLSVSILLTISVYNWFWIDKTKWKTVLIYVVFHLARCRFILLTSDACQTQPRKCHWPFLLFLSSYRQLRLCYLISGKLWAQHFWVLFSHSLQSGNNDIRCLFCNNHSISKAYKSIHFFFRL